MVFPGEGYRYIVFAMTKDADKAPKGEKAPASPQKPAETGGRDGPDPVRYGDWEKDGRCIDF